MVAVFIVVAVCPRVDGSQAGALREGAQRSSPGGMSASPGSTSHLSLSFLLDFVIFSVQIFKTAMPAQRMKRGISAAC